MNKVVKKVIVFSSIAGFVVCSGYHLSSNLSEKTPCSIEAEDYSKIKNHSNKIVAHRGLHTQYVENSYEAVKAAFDDDAVGTVEIDIQLTKDNNIVLFHDDNVNGLTSGSGKIKDLSFDEVKEFDYYSRSIDFLSEFLSSIDNNKRAKLKSEGKISNIASLDEILSIDTGKTLLVDIKFDDDNANHLIAELTRKIKEYDGNMNFIFQSTNAKYLKVLSQFLPEFQYQIIVSSKKGFMENYDDFNKFAIKHSALDEEIVAKASQDSKMLSVWTIKSLDEYEKVRDLTDGYSNIQYISDYPDCVGLWLNNDIIDFTPSSGRCLTKKSNIK